MRKLARITAISALALSAYLLGSCSGNKRMAGMKTVDNVDLARYMGTWYEIARFNHKFEKDMVGVTANYTLKPDGTIRVVNSGYKGSLDGNFKSRNGKGKVPDPSDPGKLEITFFLWFWSDYYILELDKDYRYALVGSSDDGYLWILSRTPELPRETIAMLLDKAQQRGYDVSKLIWVPQKETR